MTENRSKQRARWFVERKAKGLCRDCRKPIRGPGALRCAKHAQKYRTYMKEYMRRRRGTK